ncbi:MAG: DUF1570 domain-containing protein [Phycisphaerales bacterium]|nr:DUF1570 domain-containing protein [Phycisphaerales bacterium]
MVRRTDLTLAVVMTACAVALCGCGSSGVNRPSPSAVDPGWTDTGAWEFLGHKGRRIATDHFEIRTTVDDPRIIDALPALLEASFQDVQMLSPGLEPPKSPFITYLLADKRQWRNAVRIVVPSMVEQLHQLGRGGFTVRSVSVLYDIDPPGRCRDTLALAAHEAWHQVTQRVFKDPLPEWLEEGLATRMEGLDISATGVRPNPDNNPERHRRLRWMVYTKRLQSLRDFLRDDPYAALERDREALLDYYAQAWALATFLLEADPATRAGVGHLLADARHGRMRSKLRAAPRGLTTDERIFVTWIDPDIDALDERFQNWCRQRVSWSRRSR